MVPGRLLRGVARILLMELNPRRRHFAVEDGSKLAQAARGAAYRLVFVPVLLAVVVGVQVFVATHPPRVRQTTDGQPQDTYCELLSVRSTDGTRLDGWLIPALDARTVLAEGDSALRRKRPAAILVHDYGQSGQQMRPLIKPLHDAGMVVLVMNLRGAGSSDSGGCTFGLREAGDVRAMLEMLRRRAFVDDQRIAVIGVGSGGNAALLAARQDPALVAVADGPLPSIEAAVDRYMAPAGSWRSWLRPMCRWAFELAYRVDGDELAEAWRRRDQGRAILVFDESADRGCFTPEGIDRMVQFVGSQFAPQASASSN